MARRVSTLQPGDVTSVSESETRRIVEAFRAAGTLSHGISLTRGWYQDPKTGEMIERNQGEMIALMHSELSEALEGVRKNKQDDHLPNFKSVDIEIADLLHRTFDFCEAFGINIGEAFIAKAHYNLIRKDHSLEERAAGGKAF